MTRNAPVVRTALALLLSAGAGLAQAPAGAPPDRPSLAPPPAAAGAAGPNAPVGKVTQALQSKLKAMMRGNGLTADEVARRAVKSSSQLAAKRRAIEAADATVDEAKSRFYPTLTLSARYTRLSEVPDSTLGAGTLVVSQDPNAHAIAPTEQLFAVPLTFPVVLNQYVLSAQLSVPISDYLLRMSRAVSGAARAKHASDLDERATRLAVARDARVAYYQWIRVQGLAFVGAQSVEQANGHLSDANNAFQAGLISRADVLRAQTGVKSAELFLARVNSNVQLATTRLRVLMKDERAKQYEVGENILAPVAPLPGTASEQAASR